MDYLVRDLMVPISEYATVSIGTTLFEAVLALEEAQLNFDRSKYLHRAILVMDENNQVVGKLNQLNVLRALAVSGDNRETTSIHQLRRFGFSMQFISNIEAQRRFAGRSLRDICVLPAGMKVEMFMTPPTPGEYVDEKEPLENVIPRFLNGDHPSLLVTSNNGIIGILRLTDVFAAVFHAMEENHHESSRSIDVTHEEENQ